NNDVLLTTANTFANVFFPGPGPFTVSSSEPAATTWPIAGQPNPGHDGLAVAFSASLGAFISSGIFLVRTNAALVPTSANPTIVDGAGHDSNPAITTFPNGNLVVSYTKEFFPGSPLDTSLVFANLVDPAGGVHSQTALFPSLVSSGLHQQQSIV